MTEIPEHLLKRSKERRVALGLPTDDAGAEGAPAAPAPAAPAVAAAPPATQAAAAPPAPPRGPSPAPVAPPPAPLPPYVVAANKRKKIPIWVMPILALLPLWLFIYMESMSPPKKEVTGPLALGTEVYAKCSSCHGGAGEGGVGYQLSDGQVLLTFPDIAQQIEFVEKGTEAFQGKPYGNPDRPGGAHVGGARGIMPAWAGQLTTAEIIAVVCHERYDLGGADPTAPEYAEEYAQWCAPDAPAFLEAEAAG